MTRRDLLRAEAIRGAREYNARNADYWGWREPNHHVEIEQAVAQGVPRKLAVKHYAEIDRRNREEYIKKQKKKTLHHSTDQSTDEESEIIYSD